MDYATKTNGRIHQEERVCIIRTLDGVKMEFKGADAPSIKSVLLFYKRRKLVRVQAKRSNGGRSGDPKQRMARDLNERLAGRGGRSIQTNPSRAVELTPWWEKIGSLQTV